MTLIVIALILTASRKGSFKFFQLSFVLEKLTAEREESLSAKLVDSKQAVAQIAILNKHYGWNLPGVSKEREAKKALTAADIRARLSDSKHTETQDIVDGG